MLQSTKWLTAPPTIPRPERRGGPQFQPSPSSLRDEFIGLRYQTLACLTNIRGRFATNRRRLKRRFFAECKSLVCFYKLAVGFDGHPLSWERVK